MINSTFDVGPAAVPTEKEPEAQFQINESVLRQKASKAASTYQTLPQQRNPESWKSEWARTQATIVQLLSDLEQGAALLLALRTRAREAGHSFFPPCCQPEPPVGRPQPVG